MKKFKFIVVSKNDEFKLSDRIEQLENVKLCKIANNTQSLPSVYNRFLNEERQNNESDFIIFMHADVNLDVESLMMHIQQCEDKYDIFGLCGTSIMNVSQSPLNWWTGSNPTPQSKWGCVTHGEIGNQKSFFSSHSPNITDHEVSCIDGLCIIFGKKAIQSGILFDEKFLYDFYDTDISFQAIMKYNLKLGVLVEPSLQHYSIGKSILTQEFLMHEIDFRKKWNLEIPLSSPINQLIKA